MLDPATLNARGVRLRQAFDILQTVVTAPQQALVVAYGRAVFSNLMRAMEQDAGVQPGYFGSSGAPLPEVNPFDGTVMAAALSHEPPPFFTPPAPAPLATESTPDQPAPPSSTF